MKRLFCSVAFMIAILVAAQYSDAAPITYTANLDGISEVPVPSSPSPGTGFAMVIYDDVVHTMEVDVNFSGLSGTTTASHIHSPAGPTLNAGVATQTPSFIGFPLGVTAGSYNNTFDMTLSSSYRAGFITDNGGTAAGAEAALAASLAAGTAYFNIHTTMFPGGEIRGQLTAVPEPTTMLLLGLGLIGLAGVRRKSKM